MATKKGTKTTKPTGATTQAGSGEVSSDTKTIVTVLLLLFVYPVGLILMWVWTSWPKWVKFILTLPVVAFILGMIAVFATIILVASSHTADLKREGQMYKIEQMNLEQNQQDEMESNGDVAPSEELQMTY